MIRSYRDCHTPPLQVARCRSQENKRSGEEPAAVRSWDQPRAPNGNRERVAGNSQEFEIGVGERRPSSLRKRWCGYPLLVRQDECSKSMMYKRRRPLASVLNIKLWSFKSQYEKTSSLQRFSFGGSLFLNLNEMTLGRHQWPGDRDTHIHAVPHVAVGRGPTLLRWRSSSSTSRYTATAS